MAAARMRGTEADLVNHRDRELRRFSDLQKIWDRFSLGPSEMPHSGGLTNYRGSR
jgi:hypothetical protein